MEGQFHNTHHAMLAELHQKEVLCLYVCLSVPFMMAQHGGQTLLPVSLTTLQQTEVCAV